ncbi:nicotinamide riboside transporter PnuC [Lacipirellula parvula]|uniref:Nicotinamide riboside transporter PnuC n=1 Tax=Lacipirellula parvula TaxID=2650471 RepID=A0A5K7XFM2_9BACT|nr:nicotinamide riboside transporter PnuC [Lacipirellula parvula]BBO35610.1 ribosyl nicotinamide transporter [Lacipirellula parvula]
MSKESLTMIALGAAAAALAVTMALLGRATWLEAASFVTGTVCVWLTVKESVWNFPIGLLNVATFSVVFFQSRLFADAGLQIIYFILGVVGWRLWLRGGANRTTLRISRSSHRELLLTAIFAACCTLGLWRLLHHAGGSASFWDALTTSLSLVSQWLLNRKRLESWAGWILVDAIYVPLYVYKELYLTALLYAIFLAMAVMGWRAWQRTHRESAAETEFGPLVGVGSP